MPTITVNGKDRMVEEGTTIAGLLDVLEIHPRTVAVEHNREICRRQSFQKRELAEGDRLELVRFVQGG